jgi:GTP-binding protein
MNNIVAIVGRPNVDQPFNRLIQRREAIVDSVSEVTRWETGKSERKEFSVIDTGGYVRGSDDVFWGEIKQVELAIDKLMLSFFVDVEEGITPMDDAVQDYCVKSLNRFYCK